MKTKTSELIGIALDWAVAKCEGYTSDSYMRSAYIKTDVNNKPLGVQVPKDYEYIWFNPSTNWAIAGPIIEQTHISIGYERYSAIDGKLWDAVIPGGTSLFLEYGCTPLLAAMRCYVASKLGDEVEIPDALRCTVSGAL